MPIRVLDAATVGRIAAGEVVERPSSVVKELIENSLDAGASSISVEIKGGGIDYLRVTDNGCGIEPNQVRLAFENHATSKLSSADQLEEIMTLGFRGEALPSIASVSRLEMVTRARGMQTGMRVLIDGGSDMRVQEVGCPEGTNIIMRDLFYNIPVRKAFLKRPNYEGGLVQDVVARMILGHPNVSFRFLNNGNDVYHSFGDGKLRHSVFTVYGKETAENMIELDVAEGGVRVYGLIGVGEQAKVSRAHQAFFINGRSIRSATLTRALEEVCRTRVTIGLYPMCVLNLVVPPCSINVNVHPSKTEVRFKDDISMRDTAERLFSRAFVRERVLQLHQPGVEKTPPGREDAVDPIPSEKRPSANEQPAAPEPIAMPLPENRITVPGQREAEVSTQVPEEPPKPPEQKPEEAPSNPMINNADKAVDYQNRVDSEMQKLIDRRTREAFYEPLAMPGYCRMAEAGDDASQNAPNDAVEDPPIKLDSGVSSFRVIGVLMKTYILIETEDSLLLIDQHAAHERLNYERMKKQAEEGRGSQHLLAPVVIHLSAREMALIQDNLENLRDSGYEVEPFGAQAVQLRAVPFVLGRSELKPAFMDTINALYRLRQATNDLRRAEIIQMACKAAVKGGEMLTQNEIESLIRQMLETGAPPTCPHGRPVMKSISRTELEKMFKRIQ